MSSWTRILNALANIFIIWMWYEKLTRPTRPGREGFVTLAVGWPKNVAFSAKALSAASSFTVLKHLTFTARPFGIELEALARVPMKIDDICVTKALGGVTGVVVRK